MDIKALQLAIVDGLEDVKGQDIKVFDTTHLTSLFDRVIIASGTSNRQTRSLASSVADKVRENGGKILSIEGGETGEWVLVDCGDAIVHILQPALRQYYNLEELWGGKAVRVTTAAAKKATSRRKASEDDEADDNTPGVVSPSRMAKPALAPITPAGLAAQTTEDEPLPGSKTAARKTAAKKTAAKKAPTTARKTVARKSTGTASTGTKVAPKAAPAAKRAPAAAKRAPVAVKRAPAAKKAVARKRAAPKSGA